MEQASTFTSLSLLAKSLKNPLTHPQYNPKVHQNNSKVLYTPEKNYTKKTIANLAKAFDFVSNSIAMRHLYGTERGIIFGESLCCRRENEFCN